MGVYIKGMEIPEKQVYVILNPNGLVEVLDANNVLLEEYQAIHVPPHGRLVVRGKWNRTDAYPHRLYCSVCYKTYLKNDELLERWEFPLNFCPNCGADMREES